MTAPFDLSLAVITLLDDIESNMAVSTLNSVDEKIIERLDDDTCMLISKLLRASNEQLGSANERADRWYDKFQALSDLVYRIREIADSEASS